MLGTLGHPGKHWDIEWHRARQCYSRVHSYWDTLECSAAERVLPISVYDILGICQGEFLEEGGAGRKGTMWK